MHQKLVMTSFDNVPPESLEQLYCQKVSSITIGVANTSGIGNDGCKLYNLIPKPIIKVTVPTIFCIVEETNSSITMM